jgi:hypothetical protein
MIDGSFRVLRRKMHFRIARNCKEHSKTKKPFKNRFRMAKKTIENKEKLRYIENN